jgi:Na+/H+ antiporter NhaC
MNVLQVMGVAITVLAAGHAISEKQASEGHKALMVLGVACVLSPQLKAQLS